MKGIAILLIIVGGFCASCTSEYEERLEQGMTLKSKLSAALKSNNIYSNTLLSSEIEEMQNEIMLLAKVSGNEELFLKQIFEN